MSEVPTAARTAVDVALAAALAELRAAPGGIARLLEAFREALLGMPGEAGAPDIYPALDKVEAARRILSSHVGKKPDPASVEIACGLLRELHQVLGELHVRLFMDASTRFRQAPLVQLARDDVNFLKQQCGADAGRDSRHRTRLLVRIQAELMAMEIHDDRSAKALAEARKLVDEILAKADVDYARDLHGGR